MLSCLKPSATRCYITLVMANLALMLSRVDVDLIDSAHTIAFSDALTMLNEDQVGRRHTHSTLLQCSDWSHFTCRQLNTHVLQYLQIS